MNAENPRPDVVVIGMPSCGKTVFFTVLGKKFTNLVDGRRAAPLGFRMGTCDRETAKVINFAYDRLCGGRWPEATKEGLVMPLRWEVFTGRRRIFEMFSMDIAGETFKKAFAIKDDDGHGDGVLAPAIPMKEQHGTDSGDELYRAESKPEDLSVAGMRETDEDKAVAMLTSAIESAKVVCFMVNIALPDRQSRGDGDDEDERKILRFRSSVLNMYLSLKESPELRTKSLIVLTQAHRHQGEIERAGGPAMYLADVCGGEASELSNLAKENDIPVIAVSAINEIEHGNNELPEIRSPDRIPSAGLFGFLLTVSGMVAQGDSIVGVKDAYLAYQRERMEYLKSPSQTIRYRIVQARRCRDASDAFLRACDHYLDDTDNLSARDSKDSLTLSVVENYKLFTRNDSDVRSASDNEYAVRDELWDRALRRAVVSGEQATPDVVYGEVQEGLEKAFPEKKLGNGTNEEFIYGFGEDDLFPGSEASTFEKWIALNLREYESNFKIAIADLGESAKSAINVMDELGSHVGKAEFGPCRALLEKLHDEFEAKLSEFRAEWLDGGNAVPSCICRLAGDVAEKYSMVPKLVEEHVRREEEEREMQRQREDEQRQVERARREKMEAAFRRRRVGLVVFLLFSMVALMLFGAYYYHDEKNKDTAKAIASAVNRSDYAGAVRLYDSMCTISWLGIDGNDHLCRSFAERLALAAKDHEVRKSVAELNLKLETLNRWLSETDASFAEIGEARASCVSALAAYRALPPATLTFAEIVRPELDLNSRVWDAERCKALQQSSIEAIELVKDRWKAQQRKAGFRKSMQKSEVLLQKIRSEIGEMDMVSVTNCIAEIGRCGCKLRELAGDDEDDVKEATDFGEKVNAMQDELRKRYDAQRDEMLADLLVAAQSAMATNSVNLAWEKFDLAVALSSDESASGELSKLRERLLDFTVRAYEQLLAEIEKAVGGFRQESAISNKLLEETRKALSRLEEVRIGLQRRIPEKSDAYTRIESRIEAVWTMLPVIVQVEGICSGDGRLVDVCKSGNSSVIIDGTSPETLKRCVYLLVRQDELPSGSSRFVKVVDADGNAHHLAIPLSKLVPGVNRFDLKGQLVKGKETRK